jgi:hypothetical protein
VSESDELDDERKDEANLINVCGFVKAVSCRSNVFRGLKEIGLR